MGSRRGRIALQPLCQRNHIRRRKQQCGILPEHVDGMRPVCCSSKLTGKQCGIFAQGALGVQSHGLQGCLAGSQRVVQAVVERVVQLGSQAQRVP